MQPSTSKVGNIALKLFVSKDPHVGVARKRPFATSFGQCSASGTELETFDAYLGRARGADECIDDHADGGRPVPDQGILP